MNEIITRVPFQFKILSIIATDQVEILGRLLDGKPGSVSYSIISRASRHDIYDSFKTLGERISYFQKEGGKILIANVRLRIEKVGNYIVKSNFRIKMKKRRSL